ncbi:hypothetical protein [Aeromicrobium sp. 179-A 4D2 NHS]|uniref:hypothetical protein n=1 Tax=Aeromicrobium sp. 179-A 4D2 NHS TaxID=3142375 RepID=UPI00399F2A38
MSTDVAGVCARLRASIEPDQKMTLVTKNALSVLMAATSGTAVLGENLRNDLLAEMENRSFVDVDTRMLLALVDAAEDASRTKTGKAFDDLRALIKTHRPNYVTEGVYDPDPNLSTMYTRVKCEGDSCDFYTADSSWFVALDEHDTHLAQVLMEAGYARG